MTEKTLFVTSPYLRTARTADDQDFSAPGGHLTDDIRAEYTIAYHALFGHARLINRATLALLRQCKDGVTISELCKLAAQQGTPTIQDMAELEELFRLSYLVEKGTDERQVIDRLLAARRSRLQSGELLTSLQLVLTNACNFQCEYCFAYHFDSAVSARQHAGERVRAEKKLPVFQPGGDLDMALSDWNHDTESQSRNPRGQMSAAVAERALAEAIATRRRAGGSSLSVALFGGEPTLNRELILHLLHTFQNGEGTGVRVEFELTTNGSRLDPELIQALARYQVHTAVSIDYVCEETGQYRGRDASTVPWTVIQDSVARLVAASVPVKITSVLSEETWDRWGHDLIDFAAMLGIREIDVIVSFHADFLRRHRPTAVAHRLLAAFDYGQEVGVLLTGYWYHTYLLLVEDAKRALQADYKTCPAIGRMLSIEPNGSVFACKVTSQRLGHITDWSGIFASDVYAHYAMRAYSNGPECRGCELEGSCSGGSAGALEEQHGRIDRMNHSYCEYIRAVVDGLLQRHVRREREQAWQRDLARKPQHPRTRAIEECDDGAC